ncbi:MAG: putative peptidase M15 [Prokaryotic dsDNA virus sp.]|nr:MAG: putative peptidase M15 [Prokaryotic dsDNA virus sp.]
MYRYFSEKELACKCGNCGKGADDMSPSFMAKLEAIREELGFPLPVTSGFRCQAHNAKVSSTGLHGPHTTGHAVDIKVNRAQAVKFLRAALNHGMTGIGVSQKGRARFIHVDDLTESDGFPRPTIWSY